MREDDGYRTCFSSGYRQVVSDDVAQPVNKRPSVRDWMIAGAVGGFVLVIAFLGADKPPPPGFLAVILMALSLVGLVAFALPRWRAVKAVPQCRSIRGHAAQGALVGVVYWLIALALPITSDPSITPTVIDYLIAAAIAASLGAAGAAILFNVA